MSAEFLTMIAGVVLSLLFSYVPGLNTWFAALDSLYKRLIMLGLLLLSAAALFGLACAGILQELAGVQVTCDRAGLIGLVQAFIAAVIANQTAYMITPPAPAVTETKKIIAGQADLGIGRG